MIFSAVDMDPNAVLLFEFDWDEFLEGQTIASYAFPNFPTGITKASVSQSGNVIGVVLRDPEPDRSYDITSRVVSSSDEVLDWVLRVHATEYLAVPTGPPFASVREAIAYEPSAEGAEPMKIEMVLDDASDIVAAIAPEPDEMKTTLSTTMDTVQKTIPVADPFDFPEKGVVQIDSEVIYYSDKSTLNGLELTRAHRGRLASVPSTHTSGVEVKEVSYAIRARRAELFVFEWLWKTRSYVPSRTGVVGSESYDLSDNVLRTVKRIMGHSSGPHGGISKVVPISTFRRKRRSPLDFQRG